MLPQDLRALLIDLDGVVYRGAQVLPGAVELLPELARRGVRYAFVTNNATQGAAGFEPRLQALGIPAHTADVVTSAEATAAYLQRVASPGDHVCVVGEAGLRRAIEAVGLTVADEDARFVVVGLDRQVTYARIAAACKAIFQGAAFIGTNADRALPAEDGLHPGAGSIIAAVATTTEVSPTIIGKPQPTLLEVALDRLGVDAAHAAIVGDQVATDIRAGKAAGVGTILVAGDLAEPDPDAVPDLVVRDLSDLLARWPFAIRSASGSGESITA